MHVRSAGIALVIVAFFAPWFFSVPLLAQEQGGNFSIIPLVVSDKGKPRDILKDTVTITNETTKKLVLYADVQDFDPADGPRPMKEGPHNPDREKNLANWIEITRGRIVLQPGETVQVPYLVHINLRALPGVYHAEVGFYEGPNRRDAVAKPYSKSTMMVTIEVLDDARERLQLDSFLSDKSIFSGNSASFSYALENVGNRAMTPRGQIRIYNRRGQEVATLDVNEAGSSLAPDDSSQLASVWDAAGRFGKYKAFLDVEYGQTGTVQDTVYFWIFPWREVMIGFILLLILAAAVTYMVHVKLTYNRLGYAPAAVGGRANARVVRAASIIEEEENDDEDEIDDEEMQDDETGGHVVSLNSRSNGSASPTALTRPAPKPMNPGPTALQKRTPAQPTRIPKGRNGQPSCEHHVVNLAAKNRQ